MRKVNNDWNSVEISFMYQICILFMTWFVHVVEKCLLLFKGRRAHGFGRFVSKLLALLI